METADNTGFVYEFGKFRLDPDEKTLFVDDTPLRLPAKEFETLLLLVEHNGRAMSKEEMMSAIWQDAFVEESNLAKQISRLRKILNADGEEFIETIPKHGYRFSADLRRMSAILDSPIVVEKRTVNRLTVAYEGEPKMRALPASVRSGVTWRLTSVITVLAVLAVLAAGAWWFLFRPTGAAIPTIKTIAVLPLRSLDGSEDGRALGLGLTDSLITRLGGLKKMVVRPINAVAAVSAESDAVEIGRKLNVDAVLEGTIQRADGRLRVNARVVRTTTGEQIWADRFEQPATGLFELQDALSADIAKAFAFELNKADSDQMEHRGTGNVEAYEKYLRGRFYQSQNTAEGFNKSIDLYQQAAALDPNFAEAYAGIGDSNILLYNFGILPRAETIPKAREAVDRALNLNPDLSDAHTSNSLIQFLIDRNWPEAEKSLQRAIELNPNNADAYLRYGYFLISVGRFEEALDKLGKAREINPLSPIVGTNIGLAYLSARRYPEAIDQLEKTAAENPRFPLPLWILGTAYEAAGDPDKAFDANYKAVRAENGGGSQFVDALKKIRDEQGTAAANRWWFEESVKAPKSEGISSLVIASRAATVKDADQTLIWLERSADEGDPALEQINYLSRFDFVRDDPRFQAVASRLSY